MLSLLNWTHAIQLITVIIVQMSHPTEAMPDPSAWTLEPTQHDSHGFPQLHPNVLMHVYPERAGIPKLKGSCHPSLGSSGDICISHLRCQLRSPECSTNVLASLYVLTGLFRTLPASLPDSTSLISVFTTSPTPHSDRISAPLLRTHRR